MLIPLNWLKEFVDIKMPFPLFAEKMSAAGLTIEVWHEENGEIIFDPEITPNRPDWMSVYGIAREVAAVTDEKLKKTESAPSAVHSLKSNTLKINIKPNYAIVPRITTVIIKNVKVKSSPDWLVKRIKQIGLRPINNLVDITNYVLWQYGGLLHAFDYDKIRGHQMVVELSKGGEAFRSLDGIDYTLPKNTIIIKDVGRVIDLLPLKGGENTASSLSTKNVLLHSVVVDPILTRKTSQALGLRSDSSAIAERGLDPNSTTLALNTALKMILDIAGGEVASEIIDHKEHDFKPWTVALHHEKLESILGIKIEPKKVEKIFARLELKLNKSNLIYSVEIPSFRNDLHIEEDLIEEVGRIIGYNNFPKTLPASAVPTKKVAYAKNYDFEYSVKQILKGAGYSEIYTYSLISEYQLIKLGVDPAKTLRIDNPISRDYEYLRPNLFGNLLDSYKANQANFSDIKIYELGKRYLGETLDKFSEEYWLWSALSGDRYYEAKGTLELLLQNLGAKSVIRPTTSKDNHYWFHPGRTAQIDSPDRKYLGVVGEVHPSLLTKWGIKDRITAWGINYDLLEKLANPEITYQPIPKYPAVIEDLSLIIPENILYSQVVGEIKSTSKLISSVDLLDIHENSTTLRITYLDPQKNLTDTEISKVRPTILKKLKELGVKLK